MNNKRVLMLHQFHQPHPAHRVFGDAVNADFRHFETGEPIGGAERNTGSMVDRLTNAVSLKEYDVVIGEGTTPIYTLLFYKTFNNWDADVVPLIADETFLRISEQQTRHLWRYGVGQIMSGAISGIIAVSRLCREWASPYLNSEYHIVHPSIDDNKYHLLKNVNCSYQVEDSPQILHAGSVSDKLAVKKKNVDLLSRVVSEAGDWQLRLLGKGHNQFDYSLLANVKALGYLEELTEFAAEFEHADVFVQPSSGDAFPVASLEAMLAGVPTIVSKQTGTKELVKSVDSKLVCEPTHEGIRAGIEYAVKLDNSEREQIGKKLSQQVIDLTERNQANRFGDALEEIIS